MYSSSMYTERKKINTFAIVQTPVYISNKKIKPKDL